METRDGHFTYDKELVIQVVRKGIFGTVFQSTLHALRKITGDFSKSRESLKLNRFQPLIRKVF